MIQSFLNDAEKKQITEETVKLWLLKLESVAYDADNVLDELHYQHKKIQTQHKMKKKVRGFFPYPIRHPKIARKIKNINKNLEEINHEASNYGLQKAVVGAYAHGSLGLETDSFSNDPIFLGRKNDVSEIVEKMTIVPNDQVLSILPIVGMGGLGKSTVAREVFDHETIKSHFAKRFWVHVSKNFDVVILFKKILTSLTETNVELGNEQALLEKLENYLGTERFLLVLDDVWNGSQEKWDDFLNPLRKISHRTGNGIIVTTRLEYVASLVRTLPIHKLNSLSVDMCWSIIKEKTVGHGYDLQKERLVEMWMAEGFLEGSDDMEVRYISLESISTGESHGIPKEQAHFLRSLRLNGKICDIMFSKFKSFHVLILMHRWVEELPSSMRELIHLRCLDISGTMIKCLPNSIGELYHLQTLRACKVLMKLPDTMKHLISLRHLHIPPGIEMPPKMGRLTYLRTLPYFEVSHKEDCGIGELESLNNLQVELKIYNLEKVYDKEEAKSANLLRKPNIIKLTLAWKSAVIIEWTPRSRDNESVLDGLKPHPNLKKLYIFGFRGRRLPSWCSKMSSLNNLIEITLEDCKDVEQVPTLGHLPYLKNLYLINLRGVKTLGSSFYGIDKCSISNNTITVFPALERLELVEMWRLREWLEAELMPNATENQRLCDQVVLVVFPCLEYLMVRGNTPLSCVPSQILCLQQFGGVYSAARAQ
ncbi:hypothetical protein ABFS83_07G069000 [Erythranthe nasuta]